MPSSLKLNMLFKDRVGIVSDISARIANHGLNIVLMEVVRKRDKADVYVELESEEWTPGREGILKVLEEIDDLITIRPIETMPQVKRENRFRVVLDNISDGVVSIDKDGRIRTINNIARIIFELEDRDVIGRDIKTLKLSDLCVLDCLRGKKFNDVKKNIITSRGRFQYFATGRPIRDASDRIIGAVEIFRDMGEIKRLAQTLSQPGAITFNDFIGENPSIKEAILFAQKIAETDSIISIRGESGAGKELFARAIHTASGRKGTFIPISCAALPEQLLESELFGYVGGAFTGARKEGKPGLFEVAGDGVLFLDEIAEMPLGPQAKILRVIQEKRVRRIGDTREIPIDTRIITATNRNLERMVRNNLFRQDLYYRINVLPIHIPPLRERTDDIPPLVEHFLFQLASKLNKNLKSITETALNKLRGHNWPGNVRELKNVIERAAIFCDSARVDVDHILFSFEIGKNMAAPKPRIAPEATVHESLPSMVAGYEKGIIDQAMKRSKSIRQTSRDLGISHTTLLNKLRKHKIDVVKNRTIGNISNQN